MQGEVRVVDDVPAAFAGIVRERRPRSFVLTGGGDGHACYEQLAVHPDVEWSDTDVLLGDERWVPVDGDDSNEGAARRIMPGLASARLHSMRLAAGEDGTREQAADAYDAIVAGFDTFDLLHLGLGPDGHVASLFPGTDALEVTDRLVVPNGDDLHEHPRLTMTFPALARARLAVVTVMDGDKRDAFRRIVGGEDLPGGRVEAGRVVWLVTPAVAGTGG